MLDRLTIERMDAAAAPILVALSGGGDSVALLHLLAARFGAARLRAAIIDHALREGSAGDARRAASFAQALGVAADIHTLTWPQGPQRAQGAAREARYRKLSQAARVAGASVIAVGHTRDDQAETVLLRASRSSSWRGLAGMRVLGPLPVWPEGRALALARPLLGARRWMLRAYLQKRGAGWIEDPANANVSFARVRARATLAELADTGFEPMRLAALAERLVAYAAALDRAALALVRETAEFHDETVLLACARWRGDDAVRQRALSALVTAAGGGASEPPANQVAALEAQLLGADFKAATLAGAWLKSGKRLSGETVAIRRDRGALLGRAGGAPTPAPLPLPAGEIAVWDNRLALSMEAPGWSVVVEEGAPVLARRSERQPAEGEWLLEARVNHLLGAPEAFSSAP